MNDAPLSTQIKEARARLGYSQSRAADAWGIPVKTLQKYEQGERTPQGAALDALRQKLAGVVGEPPGGQPQDEQPQAPPAPEAQGTDASEDLPASADTPPADEPPMIPAAAVPAVVSAPEAVAVDESSLAYRHARTMAYMRAERAAEPKRRAAVHAFLGIKDDGSDWLPHLPAREAIARHYALVKAVPPLSKYV